MTSRERYAMRRDARLCVACAAGLQDEDGVTCVECHDSYYTHRTDVLEGIREKYMARKTEGACTRCGEPALPDHGMCAVHRAWHLERAREYRERKKLARGT